MRKSWKLEVGSWKFAEKKIRFYFLSSIFHLLTSNFLLAIPNFTAESGVRLSSAAPQDIVALDNAVLRMYFIRENLKVFSATSTDGLTWSEETGFRLSTETAKLDASSITSCAVLPLSTTGYRMLYSAQSSTGGFHILSATSTDGLDWTKESGVRIEASSATTFVGGVRIATTTSGLWRAYYLQDSSGGNDPADYALMTATSADQGAAWSGSAVIAAARFGPFDLIKLTNGRLRIYHGTLASGATVETQIQSQMGFSDTSFDQETGVRFSTATNAGKIVSLVVYKFSDYRWRLYYGFEALGSTIPKTLSALTLPPDPRGMSPAVAYRSDAATSFTLSGEMFSTGTVIVSFSKSGQSSVLATGVARPDDMTITGTLATLGMVLGGWDATVINSDGQSATLSGALSIDFREGIVTITDNLFKPLEGGKAKIDVTVFNDGDASVNLFTINGGFIKQLFDGPVNTGTTTIYWPGDTEKGHTVAAGLYVLHAKGPKLKKVEKIIVIK